MSGFNLSKVAAKDGTKNYNKMLEDQNKEMGIAREEDSKNINLSLAKKDQDATATLEKQMDSNRDGKDTLKVTEKAINEENKVYNERRIESPENVMAINIAAEAHDLKHQDAYKAAENKEKQDTEFWDKYIGQEIEGEKTTVDRNVPKTQLADAPERFKGLDTDVDKVIKYKVPDLVKASLRDADAMLFHIYASAKQENRDVNNKEKQMIIDINSFKNRTLFESK
jgi:hypothetical protein